MAEAGAAIAMTFRVSQIPQLDGWNPSHEGEAA